MKENQIQVLKQTELCGQQFQLYGTPDEPLFLAKDVAKILEHTDAHKMVQSVDEDEKVRNIVPTLGGPQEMWCLTEDGLYEVLMQSRKPIAKQFKKSVKKILKEIRTKSGYIAPMPDETPEQTNFRALSYSQETMERQAEEIRLLKELNAERQRTIELQQLVIDERKSRPQLAAPTASPVSYNSTRIGLELGMTAHDLNVALRDAGVIVKDGPDWHLTDAYRGMGLMRPATIAPNRKPGQVVREVWTEKGREFIINLINQSK